MVTIEYINPNHLKGISWWFWFRENISFMNHASIEIIVDFWWSPAKHSTYNDLINFGILPFAYIVGIFYGPYLRKKDAEDAANEEDLSLEVFHKNTIAYFAMLERLCSERI